MNSKKALVLGEAFYPEDFIINDLVKDWEKDGYKFEVLTRTPSYPFGKVYKGYKNKIYQKGRLLCEFKRKDNRQNNFSRAERG